MALEHFLLLLCDPHDMRHEITDDADDFTLNEWMSDFSNLKDVFGRSVMRFADAFTRTRRLFVPS